MKKTLISAMLVMSLSGSGMAQTTSPPPPSTTKPSATATLPAKPEMSAVRFHASDILGANVQNSSGEIIGKVHDVLLSPQDQESITQAIISVGGFLGMGDTLVAVPYTHLHLRRIDDTVQVIYHTTREALAEMPKFAARKPALGDKTIQVGNLMGSEVKNPTDETLGAVKDLIITGHNTVPQVIISVGGFLGMGGKLVAVPYRDLLVTRLHDQQRVVYDATPETLQAMPSFSYN